MKKYIIILGLVAYTNSSFAQWNIGGNNIAADAEVGTTSNYNLQLKTNDVARLTITKSGIISSPGKFGIGTNSISNSKFIVQGEESGCIAMFRKSLNGPGLSFSSSANVPTAYFNCYPSGVYGILMSNNSHGSLIYTNLGNGDLWYSVSPHPSAIGNNIAPQVRALMKREGSNYFYPDSSENGLVIAVNNGIGIDINSTNNATCIVAGNQSATTSTATLESYCVAGPGVRAMSEKNYGLLIDSGISIVGYFEGDVYCTGSYLPSDAKLKSNVSQFNNALTVVNNLPVKTYKYRSDGIYEHMHFAKGTQIGIMAQDLAQVLPSLVKSTTVYENQLVRGMGESRGEKIDFETVNYAGLVPVLVAALNESEAIMQLKELRLKTLESELNTYEANNKKYYSLDEQISTDEYLAQIAPIAATQPIRIDFAVGEVLHAELSIRDLDGNLLKMYDVAGKSEVIINADELLQGTYTYTLVVDGQSIDTKLLMIVE